MFIQNASKGASASVVHLPTIENGTTGIFTENLHYIIILKPWRVPTSTLNTTPHLATVGALTTISIRPLAVKSGKTHTTPFRPRLWMKLSIDFRRFLTQANIQILPLTSWGKWSLNFGQQWTWKSEERPIRFAEDVLERPTQITIWVNIYTVYYGSLVKLM